MKINYSILLLLENILKNLLHQNHWDQVLEIWYVAWPNGPLPFVQMVGPGSKTAPQQKDLGLNQRSNQVCSNEGPRVPNGPLPLGSRFES